MIKAPGEIFATKGDEPGEVNLQWDSVEGALNYIIQKANYANGSTWRHVDIVNESRYTIAGLISKRKYVFRVAAVGKQGQGSWSKEIIKNL